MKKALSLAVSSAVLLSGIGTADALTVLEKQRDVNETVSQESMDNPYYDAIRWGYESGVFDGYKEGPNAGKFVPDGTITRAEFLKMLFNVTKEEIGDEYNTKCFGDSTTDKWYNKLLCYSKSKKYLGGYSDGTFHPNDNILVSEAFKILVNNFGVSANAAEDNPSGGKWISESKWYYPVATAAISNGIRFSDKFSEEKSYEAKLTRGEMMNLLYQFYALGISKQVTKGFIDGLASKDGKATYSLLDSGSRELEVDEARYQRIVSALPVFVDGIKYKGGLFYNGYSSDFQYSDSKGEKYSRRAVRSYYVVSLRLGSKDSSDVITRNVALDTVIENGKWAVHVDANRFFDTVFVSNSSSDAGCQNSKAFGFLGFQLFQNIADDSCNYYSLGAYAMVNSKTQVGEKYYFLYQTDSFKNIGDVLPSGKHKVQ